MSKYISKYFIEENHTESILPKNRLKIILIFLILIFFILFFKLFYIALFFKNKTSNLKIINETEDLKVRNSILDRNGIIIATDIALVDFHINRELVSNPQKTVNIIHSIIPEINKERLYSKLINTNNKAKYILIKRNITPKQQISIKESGLLGFEFINTIGRIYPHKNLFSHIVGYVDIDRNGIAGLENQYNSYLNNLKNNHLELTLDIRIQSIVRQQLLKALAKYKAKSAIAIVSEVKTGNILAIVSLPDFDPNQVYLASQKDLYNKATYGVYEMGSIFKILTIALGLDQNIINLDKKYDISQIISYGNYQIKEERYSKKFMTPEDIIVRSSNIGAALIGLEIGSKKIQNFLNLIGMFERVPANFPSLARPLLPKIWRDINTITVSYGHGIAVTPLHMVMAVAGIVNNGIMKVPKFTKNENFNDIKIINEKTSNIMKIFLRNAVKNGTGWRANTLGYSVGGKTGSARLLKNGTYQEGNIMANFIGIFPMNNPSFIIYLMIESPNINDLKDNISGGVIAAPVFARIIESIGTILNVIPYVESLD